jgi:CRP/FNR family transcriptional regulator, cyclic AMP receptor protein
MREPSPSPAEPNVTTTSDVLALSADLEDHHLAPGEVLFHQGDSARSGVAILVDGVLGVELREAALPDVTTPGAFVGEVGSLLGAPRSATIVARGPATVRIVGNPEAFFASHPELALELARQLAGRLHRLTAYLDDLRAQYADEDGHLSMVDTVLGRLASRPPVDIEPGSDRSPDY